MHGLWPLLRPRPGQACDGGRNLVSRQERAAQAARAAQVLEWYMLYVDLLRRLRGGRTPTSLELFCGAGGKSEGVRRARGASHGVDSREQPDYEARFGAETFTLGDATSGVLVNRLCRKLRVEGLGASPPCKPLSTAWMRGEASEPDLVADTRATLRATGRPYAMENVLGARAQMPDAVVLHGAMFGLQVDRARLFETNFGLHVDRVLVDGGREIRAGSCLGRRNRWRRCDRFGRPEPGYCCEGNVFAVQGDKPWRCTREECAEAMGLDAPHMSYVGMSQAIPPAYGSLVFAQMCMHVCATEFGAPRWTFDDVEADPREARRVLGSWLRGAGAAPGEAALSFGVGRAEATDAGAGAGEDATGWPEGPPPPGGTPQYVPPKGGDNDTPAEATEGAVREAEFRELYYSPHGDFDRQLSGGRDPGFLETLRPHASVWEGDDASWAGHSTLVSVGRDRLRSLVPLLARVTRAEVGACVAVITEDRVAESRLRALGFAEVRRTVRGAPAYAAEGRSAQSWHARVMLAAGRRQDASRVDAVDFDEMEKHMDPRDLAEDPDEPHAKALRSYMPVGVDPSRWQGLALANELSEMMQGEGLVISPEVEPGFAEHPFYPARDPVGLMKSITEVDRALIVGSMEYVPADQVAQVRRSAIIHPWTMADQGGGKWRACHDYSCGTNRYVRSAPFGLPEVWDAAKVVGPDSHFAKYDIRDGFWHCAVSEGSRHRLVLRHPGNGRLVWATRLPFGYVDSPRLFCAVTEAIAQAVRARAAKAGVGVHVFVFVDDYLVIGDSEELTRLGCGWLEEELHRRGVEWAPHKHRGPCRCLEFLGLVLCNFEGCRRVTVSRKRLDKTRRDLSEWLARAPADMGEVEVRPQELAQLLGRLVFFSQVVRGGRTYMQGMLSSFQGLVVDWRRHRVRPASGQGWKAMRVGGAFWRDLQWWADHVDRRHSVPLQPMQHGEAALTGTDASGWGAGQVAWIDGGREEVSLRFTAAEKRRPINWRELLGVLRVVEHFGERLSGRVVLVETDNMAARGAAAKRASRAPDMQELVRRLLQQCEKWNIGLRVTHTPGEKLDRPDQTSRGDPVEEPRERVAPRLFRALERRWGPFGELLGPERAYAQRPAPGASDRVRLWVHPTARTAGSALRLVGQRLSRGEGRVNALVVLPSQQAESWAGLLRHGTIVGEVPSGVGGMEMHTPRGWRAAPPRPHSVLVSFPRAAGAYCLPVRRSFPSERTRAPYAAHPTEGELSYLTLPEGAYVYSRGSGGLAGSLCRLFQRFDPAGTVEGEVPETGDWVLVQELDRLPRRHARCRGQRHEVFELPARRKRWLRESRDFYTVDHLVSEVGRSVGSTVYLSFDWARAESEIAAGASGSDELGAAGAPRSGATSPASEWELVGGDDRAFDEAREQLSSLNLRAADSTRGPEGRLRERSWRPPEAAMGDAVTAVPVRQPSPYDGMTCRGCALPIPAGEIMVSVADGVTHDSDMCRSRAEAAVDLEAGAPPRDQVAGEAGRGVRRAGTSPAAKLLFFAAVGGDARGVFSDRAMASRAAGGLSRVRGFATMAEARDFLGGAPSHASAQPHASFTSMATEVAAEVPGGAHVGSIQRRAQASERLSEPRVRRIMDCVGGQCEHADDPRVETPTPCRGGCGRSLHMLSCAQVGKGYAALGAFTCQHCRGRRLMAIGQPSPVILERATRTMILEMTQGAESTAGSYAEYVKLAEEYASGPGLAALGRLNLPHVNAEACKNFITWYVTEKKGELSMESTMRGGEAYVTKTHPMGAMNVFKLPEVKAHAKEFIKKRGKEHAPRTTATSAMLDACTQQVIPERWPESSRGANNYLRSRWTLELLVEGVGGARVGEAVGAGDFHGLMANNTSIVSHPEFAAQKWSREVVELKLEHSKTGAPRYLDLAGTTQLTEQPVADALRRYWREAGMTVVVDDRSAGGGARIERPDYWVVRVCFLGMGQQGASSEFSRFMAAVKSSAVPAIQEVKSATMSYARQRMKADGPGSQAKKYVNIAGGAASSSAVREAVEEMNRAGLGAFVSVVPGPLIRATLGFSVTHMPLSTNSTFGTVKELLTDACKKANEQTLDPDLDLQGLLEADWNNHSLRRLSDTTARRYMKDTRFGREPVEPWEIDAYHGWNEAEMAKDMQMHYSQMSLRERIKQARITCML